MSGPGEGGRGGRGARLDVRVAMAPEPKGELLLVPPEDEELTPPMRAADLIPPRNRRPEGREDVDTPPRAQRRPGDVATGVGGDDEDEPNARPGSAPQPVFGQPLFAQEWSTAAQGTPTWKPGAPPVDHQQSRTSWYIVGAIALLGVGAMMLWLQMWD